MGNRGREKLVRCEKCGRQVRRDKAVYIDKVMLSNPLERAQVNDEQYTRVITREVCYCISCGKHGRIFEKKKQQAAQLKERKDYLSQYAARPPSANQYSVQRSVSDRPDRPPRKEKPAEQAPAEGAAAPAEQAPAQEKPASESQ